MDGKVLKGEEKAPSAVKKVVRDLGKSKKIAKTKPGKKEEKKADSGYAKHGRLTRTVIEHHPDRSRSIEHTHEDGFAHKHAVPDLDGVHDSLEEAANEPNEGEGQDQASPAAVPGMGAPQIGQ